MKNNQVLIERGNKDKSNNGIGIIMSMSDNGHNSNDFIQPCTWVC